MADSRPSADPDRGVDFAPGPGEEPGRASTMRIGQEVFAAAAEGVPGQLAEQVMSIRNWREEYIPPLRDLVVRSIESAPVALAVSEGGLAEAYRQMEFVRAGSARPLSAAVQGGLLSRRTRSGAPAPVETVEVRGVADPETELSIPYRGQRLRGYALLAELERWAELGWIEPGVVDAIALVQRNPEWLRLTGTTVAVLGAGAEMGPVHSLLRWGATVRAVDLPVPRVWNALIAQAGESAGTLQVPVRAGRGADGIGNQDVQALPGGRLAAVAGLDLLRAAPEVAGWLDDVHGPLVVGNYIYADGGTHVRTTMAVDAIMSALLAQRDDVTLAFLATPTDVFAVPYRDVEISQVNWDTRRTRMLQPPLRVIKQFRRNYDEVAISDDGSSWGIADCLVPQQGPNYALAKRLQRWRALVARDAGTTVSLNVAPATRTRSVVKNRLLAAAYAGAERFGIEVFAPATSNSLMAALLVHDVCNPDSVAHAATPVSNPLEAWTVTAVHGGLWTTAYDPRSVLGIAAVLGMFQRNA